MHCIVRNVLIYFIKVLNVLFEGALKIVYTKNQILILTPVKSEAPQKRVFPFPKKKFFFNIITIAYPLFILGMGMSVGWALYKSTFRYLTYDQLTIIKPSNLQGEI